MVVTLSTATRLGVGLCRIDVRDNGSGIPKEKLTEIFEEFFSEWPEKVGAAVCGQLQKTERACAVADISAADNVVELSADVAARK